MMHPLMAEYATFHRDPRNRVAHEIGIPLIVLGIVALLHMVKLGPVVDLAAPVILAVFMYYRSIDPRAAMDALVLFIVVYVIGAFIWWPFAIAVFLIGWIAQFIGHAYEGKAPAFLGNLLHLLIGPLWVSSHLLHRNKMEQTP